MGRFLSADTVQPNAPGSQGFNLYAYVANNPTLWVDPSGHSLGGYGGTLQFLPHVSPSTAAVAGSLSALIATTLVLARNPASWYFPEDRNTAITVLATFALVLACALIPDCMGAWKAYDRASQELGSDSTLGAGAWTAAALTNAWSNYPAPPKVTVPAPSTNPGPVSPTPNPGGSPPGWFMPAALLAALGIWQLSQYLLPSPNRGPTSGPGTGSDPASDPLSTPGPMPTPNNRPQIDTFIAGADMSETSTHIASALLANPRWSILHRQNGRYPDDWLHSDKRAPACVNRQSNQFCDEYPFAITIEGGELNRPSLKLVPADEQRRIQGPQIRWFFEKCGLAQSPLGGPAAPGSEFLVKVDFSRNTGYECKNGVRK